MGYEILTSSSPRVRSGQRKYGLKTISSERLSCFFAWFNLQDTLVFMRSMLRDVRSLWFYLANCIGSHFCSSSGLLRLCRLKFLSYNNLMPSYLLAELRRQLRFLYILRLLHYSYVFQFQSWEYSYTLLSNFWYIKVIILFFCSERWKCLYILLSTFGIMKTVIFSFSILELKALLHIVFQFQN